MFSIFTAGERAQDLIADHQPTPAQQDELDRLDYGPGPLPEFVAQTAEERHIGLLFSPWVKRAQQDDLPTFCTHQGAYAYRER